MMEKKKKKTRGKNPRAMMLFAVRADEREREKKNDGKRHRATRGHENISPLHSSALQTRSDRTAA
jgi:hypothetical protein